MSRIEGVQADVETTKGGGNHYTRIFCQNIFLTASYVRQKSDFPRRGEFRERYSSDPQLSFSFDDTSPIEGSKYGILVHGPQRNNNGEPGFAFIGVPNRSFTHFTYRYDLFEEFPDLIDTLHTEDKEITTSRPQVVEQREEEVS